MSTPAGWYPDPENSTRQRWWNGTAWADPIPVASAPGTVTTAPAIQQRRRLGCLPIFVLAAVALTIVIAISLAVGGNRGPSESEMKVNLLTKCQQLSDAVFTYKHDSSMFTTSFAEPSGTTMAARIDFTVENGFGATREIPVMCSGSGLDSFETTTITSFIADGTEYAG